MLSEIAVPEKEVLATSVDHVRDLLEVAFKPSYCRTSLDHIRLLPHGLIEFDGECMPCAQGFLESLSSMIRMPLGYAYLVDFDLFAHNFEQRKGRCNRAVTVCCDRGVAVNLADADYRPAKTIDVLLGITDESFWKLRDARVCDRGVEINLIEPGRVVAPAPGDTIELGIRVSNSETGYVGLKASLFALRLVCSNGAVMSDELGTARWNYDRRVAYATSIEKFRKDLVKLRAVLSRQVELYDERLQRNLLDRQVVNLWRRLRASDVGPADVDRILGLSAEERQTIQATVRERPAGVPSVTTGLSVWDSHNRITAEAQRLDFSRRSRLERIGGGLLTEVSLN